METIIFKVFVAIFRLVGILIFTGTIATALIDIQKKAFDSKHMGLVSMLSVNQQLVGKVK